MVKIAVVRVLPSLKAWICQMPEMNLAICSIFSSTVRPLYGKFFSCSISQSKALRKSSQFR